MVAALAAGVATPAQGAAVRTRSRLAPASSSTPPARRYPAFLTYALGTACPTAADCFAVGGTPWSTAAAVASTDGGATWRTLTLPTGVGGLASISCPSPTDCVAVGRDPNGLGLAVTTTDGGRTWSVHSIEGSMFPAAVSCPTLATCFSDGGGHFVEGGPPAYIAVSHDGGSSWVEQDTSALQYWDSLTGLSCASATDCFASGEDLNSYGRILATTDGGHTWKSVLRRPTAVIQVTCTDARVCWALNSAGVLATTDGGSSWRVEKVPAGEFGSISCVKSAGCWIAGINAAQSGPTVAADHGGSTWAAERIAAKDAYGLGSISCPSAMECVIAGGTKPGFTDMFRTDDAGAQWQLAHWSSGVDYLRNGDCPRTGHCWVAGATSAGQGAVIATSDGGASWSSEAIPSVAYILYDVTCRGTRCFAVGVSEHQTAVALASANEGRTWVAERVPAGIVNLVGVACWSSAGCMEVGTTTSGQGAVVVTTDGGAAWKSVSDNLPVGAEYLTSVVCPTAGSCIVAGGTASGSALIATTSNSGKSWHAPSMPADVTTLYSISCPTSTHCFSAGSYVTTLSESGAILATTDGGTSWSMQAVPGSVLALDGVSCATASTCAAVGASASGTAAVMTTDSGGSSWTTHTPASLAPLNGVIVGTSSWWLLGTTSAGGAVAAPSAYPPAAAAKRAASSASSIHGSAVPHGFRAESTSWTSTERGYVLGQAPCGSSWCTDVIGTSDGGGSWAFLGKVSAPIVRPTSGVSTPGVTEIRMATATTGFVFGPELFHTLNGGRTWQRISVPSGNRQVISLDANATTVFVLASPCAFASHCTRAPTFWRNPTPSGAAWSRLSLHFPVSAQGEVVLAGSSVYVADFAFGEGKSDVLYGSSDDGTTFSSLSVPCDVADTALASVAAARSGQVALLCLGGAGHGEAGKTAYRSTDRGKSFAFAGTLPADGIVTQGAVSPAGTILAATSALGSFLDLDSRGTTWTNVATESEPFGWGDPTFLSPELGYVIYAPPDQSTSEVGELFVTRDGGLHWDQVQFG